MGAFESKRVFSLYAADLAPVARDVMAHFEAQDYRASAEETVTNGWQISVSKGGTFKVVLGMQTALNVVVEPTADGTMAKAGVGVFGKQVIPSLLTLFVAWPFVLGQIWGLVRQSKLDEEALACIEKSLRQHGAERAPTPTAKFCPGCGTGLSPAAMFCSQCGCNLAT